MVARAESPIADSRFRDLAAKSADAWPAGRVFFLWVIRVRAGSSETESASRRTLDASTRSAMYLRSVARRLGNFLSATLGAWGLTLFEFLTLKKIGI